LVDKSSYLNQIELLKEKKDSTSEEEELEKIEKNIEDLTQKHEEKDQESEKYTNENNFLLVELKAIQNEEEFLKEREEQTQNLNDLDDEQKEEIINDLKNALNGKKGEIDDFIKRLESQTTKAKAVKRQSTILLSNSNVNGVTSADNEEQYDENSVQGILFAIKKKLAESTGEPEKQEFSDLVAETLALKDADIKMGCEKLLEE
jgi:hypothetical protein